MEDKLRIEQLGSLEETWEKKLRQTKRSVEKRINTSKKKAQGVYEKIITQAEISAKEELNQAQREAQDIIEELRRDVALRRSWMRNVNPEEVAERIFSDVLRNLV